MSSAKNGTVGSAQGKRQLKERPCDIHHHTLNEACTIAAQCLLIHLTLTEHDYVPNKFKNRYDTDQTDGVNMVPALISTKGKTLDHPDE
jgi:hypothetical protein